MPRTLIHSVLWKYFLKDLKGEIVHQIPSIHIHSNLPWHCAIYKSIVSDPSLSIPAASFANLWLSPVPQSHSLETPWDSCFLLLLVRCVSVLLITYLSVSAASMIFVGQYYTPKNSYCVARSDIIFVTMIVFTLLI